MSLLELIFILVLQFEAGISAEDIYIYKTPGQNVILPCGRASPSDSTCSIVSWFYHRDQSQVATEVYNGNVKQNSARAARLSLDTSCSLVINNITDEDAGRYTCRQSDSGDGDVFVFLSLLTISPHSPDADPKRDGKVTIQCSLLRDTDLGPCQQRTIFWVDETGAVLTREGVGYKFLGQNGCLSFLTVKRQSGHNRRYTCKFVDRGKVAIEADYTPVFTRGRDGQSEKPVPDQSNQAYIIGAVVGGVILLAVIAAVLIKLRKKAAVTEDDQKPVQHPVEANSNLTYVTVSHANQQTSPRKKKEEEVTYSTVKTSVKPEEDIDLSTLYSSVNK